MDLSQSMLAGETMGAYCIKILSILKETNALLELYQDTGKQKEFDRLMDRLIQNDVSLDE